MLRMARTAAEPAAALPACAPLCHPRPCWRSPLRPLPPAVGTLPDSWADFPKLELLDLSNNTGLGGTLPAAWSRAGALPALRAL